MMTGSGIKGMILGGLLAAGAIVSPPLTSTATAQTKPAEALAAQFAILAKQTDGQVGVAVQRVGSSEMVTLNKGVTFPMASTFKIAVAGRIFERIDKGELKLGQMITVDPKVIVRSDGIPAFAPHDGVALSVHNLLELMLTRSDNTATDVLTALAGGPAVVTDWVKRQGVTTGQRIDGDTARLLYRALDITNPGPGTFTENVEAAFKLDPSKRDRDINRVPNKAFNDDPRDASTPEAMVQLLLTIQNGKSLSAASTKEFIAIMERCITGAKRLKGLLPQDAVVAHKTGTLMSIANDVGLMTLPDGSKVAIAVFVKGDTKGSETQERVIAEIARTAYDYYAVGGR